MQSTRFLHLDRCRWAKDAGRCPGPCPGRAFATGEVPVGQGGYFAFVWAAIFGAALNSPHRMGSVARMRFSHEMLPDDEIVAVLRQATSLLAGEPRRALLRITLDSFPYIAAIQQFSKSIKLQVLAVAH